jgi:endoribonuclease Dicer
VISKCFAVNSPQNIFILFQNYSGDAVTRSRLEKYLDGGQMMRKESLRHSSLPCESLESDRFNEQAYRVASTEAVVNLSSSITLIYLYCSRLPSDGLVRLLLPPFHINLSLINNNNEP